MPSPDVLAGAEDIRLGDGPVGALVIHGFTSSPQVVRPIAQHLADRGVSAVAPRLPGHGTTWQDLATRASTEWVEAVEIAFEKLAADKDEVFVIGFSFGAALAIDLVARHQDRVAGLVTLASFVATKDPRRFVAPIIRPVIRSLPGVGNDTADPQGERELVYERVPTAAAYHMLRLTKRARRALPSIRCPLLVVHGRNDHTAAPFNAELVYDSVSSTDKQLLWLERSFHVLPFDYDRQEMLEAVHRFVRDHSRAD